MGPDRTSKDIAGHADAHCNLGYILRRNSFFQLAPFHEGELSEQFILYPNEQMQVEVVAVGDNASSEPLKLEVRWDGRWSENPKEMCIVGPQKIAA